MDPTQENQHEFFPDFVRPEERKPEPRGPAVGRTHKPILFTTTIEQILFAAIVAILVLCLVYFLGILRGKTLVREAGTLPAVAQVPVRAVARAGVAVSRIPQAGGPAPVPRAPLPAPQPSRPAPPAAAGQRLYTIQVVTHKKRSFAENELEAISKAGFSGKILESEGYFVVCVGQYAAKAAAQKDFAYLKSKYPDCFLRRL